MSRNHSQTVPQTVPQTAQVANPQTVPQTVNVWALPTTVAELDTVKQLVADPTVVRNTEGSFLKLALRVEPAEYPVHFTADLAKGISTLLGTDCRVSFHAKRSGKKENPLITLETRVARSDYAEPVNHKGQTGTVPQRSWFPTHVHQIYSVSAPSLFRCLALTAAYVNGHRPMTEAEKQAQADAAKLRQTAIDAMVAAGLTRDAATLGFDGGLAQSGAGEKVPGIPVEFLRHYLSTQITASPVTTGPVPTHPS